MPERNYYVYILTNSHHTTLYTGVTKDIYRRLHEHRCGHGSQFVRRYNLTKLVYYEIYPDIRSAINREKQIKGGSRKRKIDLINGMNPEWIDLADE